MIESENSRLQMVFWLQGEHGVDKQAVTAELPRCVCTIYDDRVAQPSDSYIRVRLFGTLTPHWEKQVLHQVGARNQETFTQ